MTPPTSPAIATWRRGHHAFFVLTQGLVVAFALAAEALRDGRWGRARELLELATALLDASGAAMKLAGEFSIDDYAEVIRPSMQPPALSVALSGEMSADHAALMRQLADLRTLLESHGERLEPTVTGLRRALTTLYDRHIHVCESFVAGPSLLGGSAGPPAVEVLKRIKTARLRHLGSAGGTAIDGRCARGAQRTLENDE